MSLRFAVAAVAGIVVGYVSSNPYAGFQTFALLPGYGPPLDPNSRDGDGIDSETQPEERE